MWNQDLAVGTGGKTQKVPQQVLMNSLVFTPLDQQLSHLKVESKKKKKNFQLGELQYTSTDNHNIQKTEISIMLKLHIGPILHDPVPIVTI